VYTGERGKGWWLQFTGWHASDGGPDVPIGLPRGVMTPACALGRLELATWQGTRRENHPLDFRIDITSSWYRVACGSAGSCASLVVDQQNLKGRAHDSVFASLNYGAPFEVGGPDLIEGSNIVEVTDGHLRMVVGDLPHGGWTWGTQARGIGGGAGGGEMECPPLR
jgi:hypothetical protein